MRFVRHGGNTMHKGLESRIVELERGVSHHSKVVVLLDSHETEEQALARCGHPPGTEAMFIQFVAAKRIDHE